MPLFDLEHPDTGDIITVEHPQQPTQEEAFAVIYQAPATTAVPSVAPISPEQEFSTDYTRKQQQSAFEKSLGIPGQAYNVLEGLIKMGIGGVRGAGTLLSGQIKDPISGTGDVFQTSAIEAPTRLAFDIINAARQAGNFAADRPGEVLANIIVPGIGLRSRTPGTEEISEAFKRDIENKAYAGVREGAIAPEIFGTANLPLADALPLLAAAPGVAPLATKAAVASLSPVKTAQALGRSALTKVAPKVAARTLPATVEQSAMAVLDITKEEVARHIPIVNQRVAEVFKTAPKNSQDALKFVTSTEDSLYKNAMISDRAAEAQGLAPRNDLIIQRVQQTLDDIPTMLPEERLALIKDATARYDASSMSKGRDLQQRLNKEFEAQYANDTFDRAAPANEVKLAVRNAVAEQMDEINKAVTGIDASPYSDIGSLIEFKGNLQKMVTRIEGSEAVRKTGLGAKKAANLPATKYQAAYQVKKGLLSPFQKTQLEKLDDNVSRIFKEGAKAGDYPALDSAVQQSLIQKYALPIVPPPLPVAPPVAPTATTIPPATLQAIITQSLARPPAASVPPSQLSGGITMGAAPVVAPVDVLSAELERLIEAKIKTYPRKFRNDKALARIAAKSELGIE